MANSPGLSSNCDIQVIVTESYETDVDKLEYQKPAYVAVGLIMVITFIAVFFPMVVTSSLFGMNRNLYDVPVPPPCHDSCRVSLVESIPINLTYPAGSVGHVSTYNTWMNLINLANSSIQIASLYWTLKSTETGTEDPTDWQGVSIYNELMKAGTERAINIQIAQSMPTHAQPCQDTKDLSKAGAADVRSVNFTRLMGAGVLHTKFWIVDETHVYVGSANMDWRSLTQVKEMGFVAYNCSCIAKDLKKIFDVYWYLGDSNATIPKYWPKQYETKYNTVHPFNVSLNGTRSNLYFSSSPAAFCPRGRTVDIDALLGVIDTAQEFIHIAVMDYFPITLYTTKTEFWPLIDDALRRAAVERHVAVCLMASWWNNTRPDMLRYLSSLTSLNGANGASIQVKLFQVPVYPAQEHIKFARVNHNKYMVTESTAYIGTSNWSGDYFINTGGVGVIINATEWSDDSDIWNQLEDVFQRDWNSTYAHPLTHSRHPRRHKQFDKLKFLNKMENKNHEMNEL